MRPDAGLWRIGEFTFTPVALLFPLLAALVIWALASVCARYRSAKVPVLLVPVGVGAWLAYAGLSGPSGYAAGYAFGGAWLLSGLTALGALLLLPLRVTRRAGVLGLVAAGVMLVSFYAIFLVGHRLGLYDWWGDRQVPIPPTSPR